MRKINYYLLVLLVVISSITLMGCKKNKDDHGTSYVTVEINPGIELVVEDEVVVAANGINDDGKG